MGKQVIAALMCVALLFTTWLVPVLGMLAAGIVDVGAENYRSTIDPTSGVILMPFFLAVAAGACGFLALFHLKILYGTIALLGLCAIWTGLLLFLNAPIVPALSGSTATLALAVSLSFGIWQMLRWIAASEKPDVNPVEEF